MADMFNVPTMSLKVAPMQFATFTPTQYTPQTSDPTLLAKSLQIQEAREKEANQNMDAIDTSLAAIRENLNVAEHDWLDSKANAIRKEIDDQISLGNYQSAIRIAQQSARDLKRDTDLQNKIKVNQLYNKEKERVQSMGVDPLTQRYWEYRNKYSYNGTADWKPSWTPVKDISLANLQGLAAQLTAEDVQSHSSGSSNKRQVLLDSDGNVTTDLSKAISVRESISSGGSSSVGTHIKTKEDIEKTFRALLADSNVNLALTQKFDVNYWAYNDAIARSKDESLSYFDRQSALEEANRLGSELKDENGILITSYERWLEKKVIPMFENMEYHNKTTSSSSESGIDYSNALFTMNQQRLNQKDTNIEEDVQVYGIPGNFQHEVENPGYVASKFASFF